MRKDISKRKHSGFKNVLLNVSRWMGCSILGLCLGGAAEARMGAIADHGGLKVSDPDCNDFFFKLNGQLKLDGTLFTGDVRSRRNDFLNGTNLRTAEISITAGVGEKLSYTMTGGYEPNEIEFSDNYLKISDPIKDSNLFLGQVPNPYGFENSTSGKWISFLERSMATVAFSPPYGLGVMGNIWWWDMFTFCASVTQPRQNKIPNVRFNREVSEVSLVDRLGYAARFTFSPLHTETCAYHLSIAARYQRVIATPDGSTIFDTNGRPFSDIRFRTRPEARSHNTPNILDTGPVFGKSFAVYSAEAAGIWGPLTLQAEYTIADIHRINDPLGNPRLRGGYVQASYILTGEPRTYHFTTGTLGKIIPQGDWGAWEIAIRQSYLNLNDKAVHGGEGRSTSFSLGVYVNESIRFFGNYIRSNLKPPDNQKRLLNIFAVRAQVVF